MLTTTTEALLAELSLVRARAVLDGVSDTAIHEAEWNIRYSDRDWVLRAHGMLGNRKLELTIAGFLWDTNTGWTINYSALGTFGDEPISAFGETMGSPRRMLK